MFGRTWHLPHWGSDQPHPLRRQIGLTIVAALLLATIALLLVPPHARANFVYWSNTGGTSIGRAKINGTGANNAFLPGLTDVHGVAIDSKYIYWAQGNGATSSIGRANIDGTSPNPSFIPNTAGLNFSASVRVGMAVTGSGIYWVNGGSTIGRANIDGSSPNPALVNPGGDPLCGLAVDQTFIYWLDNGLGQTIGRANQDGTGFTFSFVPGVSPNCGVAVDSSFLYWATTAQAVGRAPVGGGAGSADNNFIPNAAPSGNNACGVAVNPQYVFWGNSGTVTNSFVGRANLNGNSPNPSLIPGATSPCLLAAAPSNKITINSITRKKKKGTATINAKVPGPGQVTLNQVNTPPDVNATAAAVKQQGLTIPAASSFKLAVKPTGKTAKKLKKQVQKKGKGKVTVNVFIHFVPSGVAGVPNTDQLKVKLIKQGKKK